MWKDTIKDVILGLSLGALFVLIAFYGMEIIETLYQILLMLYLLI